MNGWDSMSGAVTLDDGLAACLAQHDADSHAQVSSDVERDLRCQHKYGAVAPGFAHAGRIAWESTRHGPFPTTVRDKTSALRPKKYCSRPVSVVE